MNVPGPRSSITRFNGDPDEVGEALLRAETPRREIIDTGGAS